MKRTIWVGIVVSAVLGACGGGSNSGEGAGSGDSTVSCVDSLVYDMEEYSFVSGPDMKVCMDLADQLIATHRMSDVVAAGVLGLKNPDCEKSNLTFNDKVCTLTGDQVCDGRTLRWDCHYESDSGRCTLKAKDCELMLTLTNASTGIGGSSGSGGSGGSGGDGVAGVDGGVGGVDGGSAFCATDGDGTDCCASANDGTCDEPDLCAPGTDGTDCMISAMCDDSCEWSKDGVCHYDMPLTEQDRLFGNYWSCDLGTDLTDCVGSCDDSCLGGDVDGVCHESGTNVFCALGTDCTDCKGDSCTTAKDGHCDEPRCDRGTDCTDCGF